MSGRFGFCSFVPETVVGKHKAGGLVGMKCYNKVVTEVANKI